MVHEIRIVGLGPGTIEQMSVGALRAIHGAKKLYFRTMRHPTVEALSPSLPHYASFDELYEQATDFEVLYRQIVDFLLAADDPVVTYAVPGHPLVGEQTVTELLRLAKERGVKTTLVPSMSALDAIYNFLQIDPTDGICIFDSLDFDGKTYDAASSALFLQLYSRLRVSDLKLSLLEHLPAEHPVTLVQAAGIPGLEKATQLPLYELDRSDTFDLLTSLYVPSYDGAESVQHLGDIFLPITDIMATLRAEDGCPWDREQTHVSLKPYLLEEAYEAFEAIDAGDFGQLCDELGDVLLQVVFHAQIASEFGHFDMDDVVQAITSKLIRRHPHIFADEHAKTAEDVERTWRAIKDKENSEKGVHSASLLDTIPKGLPALLFAEKVQTKAATVGFQWDHVEGALDKVMEELEEVKQARQSGSSAELTEEFGDLLFALVNVARYLHVTPETALIGTVQKFYRRFGYIETEAAKQGLVLDEMSLADMDALWDEAKTRV